MTEDETIERVARALWRIDMDGWEAKSQDAAWDSCHYEPDGYLAQARAALAALRPGETLPGGLVVVRVEQAGRECG